MNVELISATYNPILTMWVSARTCYSSETPIEMWNNTKEKPIESCWKLIKTILDSGHCSIAEHVNMTFAIEGISRACSHQLVRHRHCTFSQQSQRYVEIKESKQYLLEVLDRYDGAEMEAICDKYFVKYKDRICSDLIRTLCNYRDMIDGGCKPEDARSVLPNATKTNLVMTCNLRELMHICNLRLCTRSQYEIRELVTRMREQAVLYERHFAELLMPQCEVHGFCTEAKCCGHKPKISDIMK